jgi:hypothetical protein
VVFTLQWVEGRSKSLQMHMGKATIAPSEKVGNFSETRRPE